MFLITGTPFIVLCRWYAFYKLKVYGNLVLSDDAQHFLGIKYF